MANEDFDPKGAIQQVAADNNGVAFDNKVKEAICRSTYVRAEIKSLLWELIKEKMMWIVLGAFSFVLLELFKQLGFSLIGLIGK